MHRPPECADCPNAEPACAGWNDLVRGRRTGLSVLRYCRKSPAEKKLDLLAAVLQRAVLGLSLAILGREREQAAAFLAAGSLIVDLRAALAADARLLLQHVNSARAGGHNNNS